MFIKCFFNSLFSSAFSQDIGLALGYDTSNNATLWKDRVALEMNAAVLHSFKLANATIVDQVVQGEFNRKRIFVVGNLTLPN